MTGFNGIKKEYSSVTNEEVICESAQETINLITDHNRMLYTKKTEEEYESNRLLIEEVSSINLNTYFKRTKKLMALCVLKSLTNIGILSLGELVQSLEYEPDRKLVKIINFVSGSIPKKLVEIAKCFNEEINEDTENLEYIMYDDEKWTKISEFTTKQAQELLKSVMKKIEELDVKEKQKIETFDENNIQLFRQNCKNPKLRNIYFRLLHNDFYTRKKMKKYRMVDSDKCSRCNIEEDLKHLLWECVHAHHIWTLYNQLAVKTGAKEIKCFDDIFVTETNQANCTIKIKIIQEMIQKERPKNWSMENIKKITSDIMKIEEHNAYNEKQRVNFVKKWFLFLND